MSQKSILGAVLILFGMFCFCIWIYAVFRPESGDGLLIGLFIACAALVASGTGITYEELDK